MNQFDRILGSLVWSTFGDALACCSETPTDDLFPQELELREWKLRTSKGHVAMPIGSYAADSQLRLATSRSLGANGAFDVESFSKVELVVWRSYAVRASSGLKAAARSLLKPDVQWNSNFFSDRRADYIDQKTYEAAARIQPHVLSAAPAMKDSEVLRAVIRNAIVTHGHPEGFICAAFHALCLCYSLREGRVAQLKNLKEIIANLRYLPVLIRKDDLLEQIWLSVWENRFGSTLDHAVKDAVRSLAAAIDGLGLLSPSGNPLEVFNKLLSLPCLGIKHSGFRAVVLAAALSILCEDCAEEAMDICVRSGEQGVATLVGATIGMVTDLFPPQDVLDFEYITAVARKLCDLREGRPVAAFDYPDLLSWQPPRGEFNYVGMSGGTWSLAGLGEMKLIETQEERLTSNDADWQWFRLHFGQHILAKVCNEPVTLDDSLLPVKWNRRINSGQSRNAALNATEAMRLVVQSGFDHSTIGDCIVRLSRQPNGLQQAVSFAELLAGSLSVNVETETDDLPLSLSSLVNRWTSGERFRFTFFFKHKQPSVGVDQSCFSQWFDRSFFVNDIEYNTAEHWMMAEKARVFGDNDALKLILNARSPKIAKSIGRRIESFSPEIWDKERVRIVREGNLAKFQQHSDLRRCLLSTRGTILVEAASRDTVWGIGLSASDNRSKDPTQWCGLNLLGFILTEVRDMLSKE